MIPRSIWLPAFLFLGGLTAAAEMKNTVWQLNRTDRIGGAVTEVIGTPNVVAQQAVWFNGTGDGLLIPVNPLANCPAFTVEMLIRPESGGGVEQRFFHAEDTAEVRALLELRVLGDKWYLDSFLRAGKESRALLDPAKSHPLDRWYWVAMSYDGKTLTSFVNGVREMSGEITFPAMKEGRVSLGVRQNKVSWFKGAIREVRFHPASLAAEQLQGVAALPLQSD